MPTLDPAGADQPAGAVVSDDHGILISPPQDGGDAGYPRSSIELVELDDQGEMWAGSFTAALMPMAAPGTWSRR